MKVFYRLAFVLLVLFAACSESDDIAMHSPFTGYWSATETCSGADVTYQLHVISSSSDVNKISLCNLDNMGYSIGVSAVVVGDSFTIPLQWLDRYQISGWGYLSSDNDSLYYYWEGGPNGNCTARAKLRDI